MEILYEMNLVRIWKIVALQMETQGFLHFALRAPVEMTSLGDWDMRSLGLVTMDPHIE